MKTSCFFPFVRILSAFGLLVALAIGARGQGVTNVTMPIVSIQASHPAASESGTNGQFRISREGPTNSALYVYCAIEGTASNGVDYAALQYYIPIPAGVRAVEVPVIPIDDTDVEGPETVTLRLMYPLTTPPINYLIGQASNATVTIYDNDPQPPNTNNHPPTATIISPTNNSAFTAPANIYLFATAHDPDVGDTVAAVEFFAGTNDLGPGFLVVVDPPGINGVTGPMYVLSWTNVPPGTYELHARATDSHGTTGTSTGVNISVLGDRPPVVSVTATDPQAMEPGSSNAPNNGVFRIQRTGSTSNDLTVTLAIGGTASNGVDYVAISNTIVIPAGQQAVELPIVPLPDTLVENYETAVLHIVAPGCPTANPPPGCYVAGQPAEAVVYIYDNYLPPPPTNHPPSVSLYTPTNNATFSAPANILIGAQAYDQDSTDYVATVEFFAGTNSLGVTTNNPLSGSPVNPFQLTWSNVPPGVYYLRAKATDSHGAESFSDYRRVEVGAPPQPVVTIQATDAQASEPGLGAVNPGVFRVARTGPTNEDLLVYLTIRGSASNGVDYATISNVVVIPAGRLAVELVITPLTDALLEGVETVELSLEPLACIAIFPPPPGCYLVGNPNAAVVYITDSNTVPPSTNRPPVAYLVSPKNGAVFVSPVDITLVAEAADGDGQVTNVEFFAGDHLLGNDDTGVSNHYSIVWSNVVPGIYNLRAKATDDDGAKGTSYPISITVLSTNRPPDTNHPPVVTIRARDPLAAEGTNYGRWLPTSNTIPVGIYPDGTNTATFVVRRDGPTNVSLDVNYTVRGTASNGVDYLTIPGVVNLPAGSRYALIVIRPVDDAIPECAETVILNVRPNTNAPNYVIGWPERAGAIILDNDTPPPGTQLLCDGTFQIGRAAVNGSAYRIEVTTDMTNWLPVCTNTVMDGGIYFTDPETADSDARFYRAVPMESAPVE